MTTAAARPAASCEPAVEQALLALPAAASACRLGTCAQLDCCQSPADMGQGSLQRLPADYAALNGGSDVSRHASSGGSATIASTGPLEAVMQQQQQQPGSGPCTPQPPYETAVETSELRGRAAGQAGRAPAATATVSNTHRADPAGATAASDGASLDCPTQTRVRTFVHCVTGSPLVQSALLYLELEGQHPAALPAIGSQAAEAGPAGQAEAAGLEWTLAQMLALWLRAGYQQARESTLLGTLWLLESTQDAWRSPATVCLATYTKLVGAFSTELVDTLTAAWPAAFANMKRNLVHRQMELLQRVGWRVRLDLGADVAPCHTLLFSPPELDSSRLGPGQPQVQAALPPLNPAQQDSVASMRQLCAAIRERAQRLQACSTARLPPKDHEVKRPAKRQRAAAA